MAQDGDHGEGWRVQRSRKQRRHQAGLRQDGNGAGRGLTAQRSVQRQLPEHLRRSSEPAPPWRAGGQKQVAGKGRPWPFQNGAPTSKRGREQVPCCNPDCPGVAGRQSFKYADALEQGKGQHCWSCVACDMPWQRSWNVHFNGHTPPARGKFRSSRWADYEEDDEWDMDEPAACSPAYDALPATYKAILADIIAAPDEETRQRAIDHFKDDNSPTGKAMVAAYVETMATKQAVDRPALRHPRGDPAGALDLLKKEKNAAEQAHRAAAAALQRKDLQVLAIQERAAQVQKELLKAQQDQAELAAIKEEKCRELALKDQQMAAAIAQRERELLLEAGTPAGTAIPRPAAGSGLQNQQVLEVVEKLTNLGAEIRQNGNCNLPLLLEALAQLAPALSALGMPATGAAAPVPPMGGSQPPTPQQELNEVTMVEGKRKPEGDAEEQDDGEESAAASLLGDATAAAQKGGVERKKTKTADQDLSPSMAKTIADAEAVRRLVNKSLRGAEGSASSSTGQQLG